MAKTAVIEFDEYPDEWVRVRLDISVREFGVLVDTYNQAALRYMPEPIATLCDTFGPFLVEWSFPETADAEGLRERNVNLLLSLARSTIEGVRDVPLPLPRRSSDGEPSAAPSPTT